MATGWPDVDHQQYHQHVEVPKMTLPLSTLSKATPYTYPVSVWFMRVSMRILYLPNLLATFHGWIEFSSQVISVVALDISITWKDTLPETNMSPLRIDGWKTILFFWGKKPIFRCKLAVSFRGDVKLQVGTILKTSASALCLSLCCV